MPPALQRCSRMPETGWRLTCLIHLCGHLNMTHENMFNSMEQTSFLCVFTLSLWPLSNQLKKEKAAFSSSLGCPRFAVFKSKNLVSLPSHR